MCANLLCLTDALAHLDEASGSIAQLGAARFEPLRLNCLAKTLRAMGRRDEALPLLRHSVEASRETSLTFSGPSALGALALTTDDPDERRRAIEEGEGLLRAGSLAHNHFRFYRDTIDAALRAEEWSEAERLAEALATFAAAGAAAVDRLPCRARARAGGLGSRRARRTQDGLNCVALPSRLNRQVCSWHCRRSRLRWPS